MGYPYGDPAYRKNATRDATATLKAWLNEHRKNPYPTKGEKIMLAIITKMTLTQVSTWFANARRRLKKENKMTWTPRNRSEDEEEDDNIDLEKNDDDEEPLKPTAEIGSKNVAGEFKSLLKNIGFHAAVGLKYRFFPGISLVSKVLANIYVIHWIDLNMLLLSLDLDRVIRPNPWNALV